MEDWGSDYKRCGEYYTYSTVKRISLGYSCVHFQRPFNEGWADQQQQRWVSLAGGLITSRFAKRRDHFRRLFLARFQQRADAPPPPPTTTTTTTTSLWFKLVVAVHLRVSYRQFSSWCVWSRKVKRCFSGSFFSCIARSKTSTMNLITECVVAIACYVVRIEN